MFELRVAGLRAMAKVDGAKFVVLEGSQARAVATPPLVAHSFNALRNALLAEGRLVPTDDPNLLTYTSDVVFNSVSAAAAVTLGRPSNGRIEWRVQGSKQTYQEWTLSSSDVPAMTATMVDQTATGPKFEWILFFRALTQQLLTYENRQPELVEVLRKAGITVNNDEGKPLDVIDPFSFYSMILKYKVDSRVHELLTRIGQLLSMTESAPAILVGVPWSDPRSPLFFSYASKRQPQDLPILWKLARQAVTAEVDAVTFAQALEIRMVGVPRLTQGLYWLNPTKFLPLNGVNSPYLLDLGINVPANLESLAEYQVVLAQAHEVEPDFPKLTNDAWVAVQSLRNPTPSTPHKPVKLPSPVFLSPPGLELNQVLYGPPGTGKTYTAIDEALKILDPDFFAAHQAPERRPARKERFDELVAQEAVTFVTFHQSFEYSDFIEGLRPRIKNGQLTYEIHDGLFLQAVKRAGGSLDRETADDNLRAHVLIIDEINRGNVSKIFGELMTLLEDNKRGGADEELSVVLPISNRRLSVPQSLYVIATMNTADRSLTQLDTALRRRFTFTAVWPEPALLQPNQPFEGGTLNLQAFLQALNNRIELRLGRDQMIGHAYLMNLKPTLEDLARTLRTKILPLLEEYFFEDWPSIRAVLGDTHKKPLDQFVHEVELQGSGKAKRYVYNEEAFKRLSAFQGVYHPS